MSTDQSANKLRRRVNATEGFENGLASSETTVQPNLGLSSQKHRRGESNWSGTKDAPSTGIADSASEVTRLWLTSRTISAPGSPAVYRPKGEDRPVTRANLSLAAQLVRLTWRPFLALFIHGQVVNVAIYLAGRVVKGLIPTARLWASSQMLDMVQASFHSQGIERSEVYRVAALSTFLTMGEDVFQLLLRNNDEQVRDRVNHNLERAYLAAELSLSIPALSSTDISALMYEAGVFAGYEARFTAQGVAMRSGGGPFDCLYTVFSLLTTAITVVSQLYLLLSTLSRGSSELNWSSLCLIALSLAPSVLPMVANVFKASYFQHNRFRNHHSASVNERNVRSLARDAGFKQEIVLFGLQDWVLGKWDSMRESRRQMREQDNRGYIAYDLAVRTIQEGIKSSFYVLLAIQALPTTLSLGSIRLYQSTAESLLKSVQNLTSTLTKVYQNVFYLAAFLEAIDLPNRPHLLRSVQLQDSELLDFEDYRVQGGMRLVATNLNFRYPGTSKDVLRDVNLTIEPGSTLAIVGFNGGGKTTLVKALMGLYDHTGALHLNGQPIQAYDPRTIHRRTSCLYQDFSKYAFSFRENVGVGQVDQMGDDALIRRAIERGGADAILDKVGLEGKLNRHGAPSMASGEGEISWVDARPGRFRMGMAMGIDMGMPAMPMGMPNLMPGMFGFGRGGGPPGGRPRGPPPGMPPPPAGMPPPPPPDLGDMPPPPLPPGVTFQEAVKPDQPDKVTERYASLSGGQWQRVALARAFMRASEADLVVFDEPSASLDPRAEAQLFERIHALSHQNGRRCTTIYISHRFSTVKRADQIAVLENGTIVECGPHAELMAKKGRYAELYNLQKSGFEDD